MHSRGGGDMITEKAIPLINELLARGLDVEIQRRSDKVVIMSEGKKTEMSFPRKKRYRRRKITDNK